MYLGRDPVTGAKRHESKTFTGTKRAAQTELAKFVTKQSNRSATSAMTVGALLDAYCDHADRIGRSPTTVAEYRRQAEALSDGLGQIRLSKLTSKNLDDLYTVLSERGFPDGRGPLAPASVRRYHALLTAALRQAENWGYISDNPARRASPPSEPRRRATSPSPAELRQMVDGAAAEQPQYGVFLALAAITGARRGELAALRWSDIDLKAGVVHVRRSLKQVGGEVTEGDTKTHKERSVALPVSAVDKLRELRRQIDQEARKRKIAVTSDAFVFSPVIAHDRPFAPLSLTAMFRRVARNLGMPWHLHQLRHFAATQAIAAGIDPVAVASRLGHADPSITMRAYAHALEERDRAAAETLGALVALPELPDLPKRR